MPKIFSKFLTAFITLKAMKLNSKIILLSILAATCACTLFNDKVVDLSINSTPSGATIFVDGQNYGRTPAVISIEPKTHDIILAKEGYGSTSFAPEVWWGKGRTDVNGNITRDGTRCLTDFLTASLWFLNSSRCGDFKQKQYFINIPKTVKSVDNDAGFERRPAAINYYNQDIIADPEYQKWNSYQGYNQQQYRR